MKYLITGCTGSLGREVMTRLLSDKENEVIGYSRDETKQVAVPKHDRLTLYLGDVRDRKRLREACRGVDLIFHFAALKHVDKLEDNPEEAIATNIKGTENVLYAQRMCGIKRVVLSSTDKAAYTVNVYGATKLIAERLVLRNPNNVVCRYGNVLASRGSVVPKIVTSLKERQEVDITDRNMTRFWIRIEDAAKFVINSSKDGLGGLKMPSMKATNMATLTQAIADVMGVKSYKINDVGPRPGEKLSECLRTEYEGGDIFSHSAAQYSESDLVGLLEPIVAGLT